MNLVQMWRLVRNTVHNNGVYFDRRGTDQQVAFRGSTYRFQHGKKLDFVMWDLVLDLTDDLVALLHWIVTDPVLERIEQEITDPFA